MKLTLRSLIGIAALALAMITFTAPAQNVVNELAVTNTLATVSNGTFIASSGTSPVIALPSGSDLTLLVDSYADNTNNAAATTTYYFNLGLQGTNWTTGYPLSAAVTDNGTNLVGTPFYFVRTNFLGFDQIRCDKVVTTQTNNVRSRLFFSWPVWQHNY